MLNHTRTYSLPRRVWTLPAPARGRGVLHDHLGFGGRDDGDDLASLDLALLDELDPALERFGLPTASGLDSCAVTRTV